METALDAYGETIQIGNTVVYSTGNLEKGIVETIRAYRRHGRLTKELTIRAMQRDGRMSKRLCKQKDSKATVKV